MHKSEHKYRGGNKHTLIMQKAIFLASEDKRQSMPIYLAKYLNILEKGAFFEKEGSIFTSLFQHLSMVLHIFRHSICIAKHHHRECLEQHHPLNRER